MRLSVRHQLRYSYQEKISLNPHTLYLYPKLYPHQRLINYELEISPEPSKIIRNTDIEGNIQQIVYFNPEPADHLVVEAVMSIESLPVNMLDFVLFPFSAQKLPFQYPIHQQKYLSPYLISGSTHPYTEQFARKIAASVNWQTVPFLVTLAKHIQTEFSYIKRETGLALPPEETLRLQSGSCRDYVRLFTAACASLGIASRFVSGYLFGNELQQHELHSWAEVFLPGAGWRGFDPTEGTPVVHHHISLGASGDFDQLAPVMGSFSGTTTSSLQTSVLLNELI